MAALPGHVRSSTQVVERLSTEDFTNLDRVACAIGNRRDLSTIVAQRTGVDGRRITMPRLLSTASLLDGRVRMILARNNQTRIVRSRLTSKQWFGRIRRT